MKNCITFSLSLLCISAFTQAQIYAPSSTVLPTSGSSGTNIGLDEDDPQARLHIPDDIDNCEGILLLETKERTTGQGGGGGEEAGTTPTCVETPFAFRVDFEGLNSGTVVNIDAFGRMDVGLGTYQLTNNNTFLSTKENFGVYNSTNEFFKLDYTTTPRLFWYHPVSTSTDAQMKFSFGTGNFGASAIDVMTLTPDGKVAINTTDMPVGYNLYVNGKILTTELTVKLKQDWPDFVFSPGYKRMSLEETESFIKINGHLPGVPSAEEVAAKGVDVGVMNAILLQKIEELTLEVIELKKDIAESKKDD